MTQDTTASRDSTCGGCEQHTGVTRRTMFRGAAVTGVAVPFLAACGGGDSSSGSGGDGSSGSGSGGGATTLATADVPVGGGKILPDQQIVVTQPTDGDFKAFTAVCTHQGCTVSSVEDEQIVCKCHNSHFSIEDGSPVSGPAKAALASKKVTVEGDQISVS